MTYNNKIIAWAKETGKKLRISTYDMTGEEGWVPLVYANNDAGAMNKAKNEEHTPGPWFIERRTNDEALDLETQIEVAEQDFAQNAQKSQKIRLIQKNCVIIDS